MPLKGIPALISPELLYALASMGHGDEIVLADSNFPSESIARANGARLIVCDGLPVPRLLRQILKLFPLDQYVTEPVALMDLVDDDKKKGLDVPIWNEYKQIVGNNVQFEMVERFQFYERAKKCFAVVRKSYMPRIDEKDSHGSTFGNLNVMMNSHTSFPYIFIILIEADRDVS
jgi:L-fucose mutarotase